ncbi:MAG TPA: ABC transporter ATP-binding protein [Synergistaceae bacterium]|nr:ABC transporter ATP-binding protein [Synergistaceae bacterium]HPJ25040.1 ABC transporter ATP-binding protein [Synergistaceae bacterium]HPQ36674.1 ABC transporter ATP-binding protein [Synergistaceae bacterium]
MKPALEVRHLTKYFGNFAAVKDLSLRVERGQIYGFLGPNGSGKSTTIRMICGLLPPTEGEGEVLGLELRRHRHTLRQRIGYMSQKFSLYQDLTVEENLRFYAGMYGLEGKYRTKRIEAMLELARLGSRKKDLATALPAGMRQRLALASSLLHEPELLFLDEPTSGVDPLSRRHFWEIIYDLAARGTTILVTTHFMDEAEHCEILGFIFEGTLLASGSPGELKERLRGKLYGLERENPMDLLENLSSRTSEEMEDCYVSGNSVLISSSKKLPEDLAELGFHPVSPTLEDVFVFLVREGKKEPTS